MGAAHLSSASQTTKAQHANHYTSKGHDGCGPSVVRVDHDDRATTHMQLQNMNSRHVARIGHDDSATINNYTSQGRAGGRVSIGPCPIKSETQISISTGRCLIKPTHDPETTSLTLKIPTRVLINRPFHQDGGHHTSIVYFKAGVNWHSQLL